MTCLPWYRKNDKDKARERERKKEKRQFEFGGKRGYLVEFEMALCAK